MKKRTNQPNKTHETNKTKLVYSLFWFYPRAKLNLFMQLTMVLETELELYLHINVLIARRISSFKILRADMICVQNNGRMVVVFVVCCLS